MGANRYVVHVALALGAACLAAAPARAELVTNGGFNGNGDPWIFASNAFLASDAYGIAAGNQAAVVGSSFNNPGRLIQYFNAEIGATYDLSFTYWGSGRSGKTLDFEVQVYSDSEVFSDYVALTNYVPPADPSGYATAHYTFTANATILRLRFQHFDTDTALVIDDVSITGQRTQDVPEPATWALAALALAAGGMARRQHARGRSA